MAEAPAAIVFDFDGVILDSANIKTRAFRDLFDPEGPSARDAIVEYHKAHGGISRFEKFRWAYREVLRRPLTDAEEARLGSRFNELVEEAVMAAAWIPGAREFLEARAATLPLFVASGTPETELRRIVERRGMNRFFRGVFGSPAKKDAILRAIADSIGTPPARLAMIGDAVTDFEGARAAGAEFVGVVVDGAVNPFPAGTPVCGDLRDLERMLRL